MRRSRAETSPSRGYCRGHVIVQLALAAGVKALPKEDEHEFNSSGDDWLNEVLVVDDEVDVELTWVAGAGTALRGPYRRNGRSTTFRHRKKRRNEATASAVADKKAGLKQTSLNSASELPRLITLLHLARSQESTKKHSTQMNLMMIEIHSLLRNVLLRWRNLVIRISVQYQAVTRYNIDTNSITSATI